MQEVNINALINIEPREKIQTETKSDFSQLVSLFDEAGFYNDSEEFKELSENSRMIASSSSLPTRVPRLRFKADDGRDYPEWEEKKLGEIGKFQTSSIDKLTQENEKEVFLVNYMNVYRHENIDNQTIKNFQVVTAKDNQIDSCNLKKGDILFTPSSETPDDIGHSVVIFEDLENAVFSYHLMRFRPSIDMDILYSHYFCNIPSVLNQLSKLATGSTRFTISVKSFSSIEIQLPCLAEQTKIASFLSSVDTKIDQLSQKKTLLEQYKKGVMQQIFSQQIRFKADDGSDYLDWEEKKLGEVAEKKSSSISANKIEDNHGDYIIYGAAGVLKTVDFYEEENDYIGIVKDGAGVGRLLFCKGYSSVLGTMDIIKPKLNMNTYFLYSILSLIDFNKYVTGSTIPHIYFKDYSIEHCGVPCLEEQTKIANFLTAIDSKIEQVAQQLVAAKQFKKGLFQQMFV